MLEFAGRIALRVDIGNFLELEGAFQRDREERAAPEEQGIASPGEPAGDFRDPVLDQQGLRHRAGKRG